MYLRNSLDSFNDTCNCCYSLHLLCSLTRVVSHLDQDLFVRYRSIHLLPGSKKLIYEESEMIIGVPEVRYDHLGALNALQRCDICFL